MSQPARTPSAMFTRSLLRLGKDAGATLVESYIAADGARAYQVHDSLVVAIGDNSRLDHIRLVEDAARPSILPPPSSRWVRTRTSTPSA